MIRPSHLDKGHDSSQFDCGIELLNVYLQQYARQNQKKEGARTYVVLDGERIIGYYTLVFGSVSWLEAPEKLKSGLGKYPIPVLLIARLAVDKFYAGRGLGSDLLQDALRRSVLASEIAGLCAVIVDAKNEQARKFYLGQNFHAFPEDPMRLFLTMAELKKAVIVK